MFSCVKMLKQLFFSYIFVSFIGKPIPDKINITTGVSFTKGIEFSSTIIAYPEPLYELEYKNGKRNNQIMNNITRNAVNNFTVYFRQPVVNQRSFGLYYLILRNLFGESTVIVNVIEQSKCLDILSLKRSTCILSSKFYFSYYKKLYQLLRVRYFGIRKRSIH